MRTHSQQTDLDHRERHEFDNGYGASIVCHKFSYGYEQGEFEIAVLHNDDICCATPITNNVLGYVEPRRVDSILKKIENLPPNDQCDHKGPSFLVTDD
jgi:hypothetical protein